MGGAGGAMAPMGNSWGSSPTGFSAGSAAHYPGSRNNGGGSLQRPNPGGTDVTPNGPGASGGQPTQSNIPPWVPQHPSGGGQPTQPNIPPWVPQHPSGQYNPQGVAPAGVQMPPINMGNFNPSTFGHLNNMFSGGIGGK